MSRIGKGYEARLRSLLQQAGARRIERGLLWLLKQAEGLSKTRQIPLNAALGQVCDRLARQARKRQPRSPGPALRFFCDAGLGGLARWLRAAGYEAFWKPDISDEDLLREARRLSAAILTTDSMILERRVVRDRLIPLFWLPPTLTIAEQLALVFQEFKLKAADPRCMSCGGQLRRQSKESLRERIPPRTYQWLDDYFVCSRCGKLFWQGTHWERILKTLGEVKS